MILLASVLATLVAVIAAGELLLRPLGPLTEVVARVGRGERGVRAGTSGYGEIGLLAREVDRMAEALDRRDEQLGELRDLSLLVGSLAERAEVARRVAHGGAKLVRANGCAVCPPPGGDPGLEASAGELPDAALVAEVGGGALRTSGAFARPTGRSSGELLGVPLTGSDDHPLGALVVHRRDRPFDDDDRAMVAAFASFAAVALDNARRLALQHALVEELQEVVDRRRDLIGNITHEFRTPLACIEGFTTALIDGWERYSEEERQELVQRIARHGEELDDLVSRFLDFTVTERGSLTARIDQVELDAAVRQAVDALAPLLSERQVEVDVPALTVSADSALLRRTLTNLLSNAVKYSSPGSRVTVRAVVDEVRVRVDVVDEGAGLTVQEAARAFEPFWRGGDPTTRVQRGAGLGLALVAEYVRAMGGSTGVTSEPGRGSTFFFTLPLATFRSPDAAAQEVTA
jgi:signal transduction histidine kinase